MVAQPFGVDDPRTIEALDAYVKLLRAAARCWRVSSLDWLPPA